MYLKCFKHQIDHASYCHSSGFLFNAHKVIHGKNIRMGDDRTAWCKRSCTDGVANIRTDTAD